MRRFSLILALLAGAAAAQVPPSTRRSSTPVERERLAPPMGRIGPTLIKADIDTWLDGMIPYAIRTGGVAGAVVVVVRDGAIVTERGYGFADVAARRPVDPRTTLFRPGSISKLFTWTAVMQQVEQGRIGLDTDINSYLDFKIPPYRGQPITMRQLMTHTAGFEEALSGLYAADGKAVPPSLAAMVKDWIPHRIFAPGTTPAYSNYGAMLAGYVVQRVSGEAYDEYVNRHIFRPLGMDHSTMTEPLPPSLVRFASQGYASASQPAKPFEVVTFRPGGSASASGDDIAKFMIAHLEPDHNPLLRPETMRRMQQTPLTLIPQLNRMMLGFYEQNLNGRRIIGHGGDTRWFHSALWLLPDERTGIFFSMNSAGTGTVSQTIRAALIESFMNRYFPATPTAPRPFTRRPADAALMAGTYQTSRRSESGLRRALSFFMQTTVSADPKGNLRILGPYFSGLDGGPREWVEIAPFIWKDRDSDERLSAEIRDGNVVRFAVSSSSPFTMFSPAPWYRSTGWLTPTLALSLLIILGFAISAPAAWLVRRIYAAESRLKGRERRVYLAAIYLASAAIALLYCWYSLIDSLSVQILGIGTTVLQLATIIVLPGLTAMSMWFMVTAIGAKRSWKAVWVRLPVALAAGLILWAAIVFNLLHLGLDY